MSTVLFVELDQREPVHGKPLLGRIIVTVLVGDANRTELRHGVQEVKASMSTEDNWIRTAGVAEHFLHLASLVIPSYGIYPITPV